MSAYNNNDNDAERGQAAATLANRPTAATGMVHNTSTVDINNIGFFPIPWYACAAYLVYLGVFIGAILYAHHEYVAMPKNVDFGDTNGSGKPNQAIKRESVVSPFLIIICVTFALKAVIVPLYRYLMLVRFRACQRGELHWSLSLRPTRVMFYRDPEFFLWYYNMYPVMHSWITLCVTIIESLFFYPIFKAAINSEPPASAPLAPIIIMFTLLFIPYVVFVVRARRAATKFIMPHLQPGYGAVNE